MLTIYINITFNLRCKLIKVIKEHLLTVRNYMNTWN